MNRSAVRSDTLLNNHHRQADMNKTLITFTMTLILGSVAPSVHSADYQYTAITRAPVAARQGVVTVGDIKWQCKGNRCTVSWPWPYPPVPACQALAREVGPLVSFGHHGVQLGGAQIQQCNSGVAGASIPPTSAPQGLSGAKPPVASTAGAAPRAGTRPIPGALAPSTPSATTSSLKDSTGSAVTTVPRGITQGGSRPEPPTRPGGFAPAAGELPGGAGLPAGSGAAAPSAPPRGAAGTLRQAHANLQTRPRIERVTNDAPEAGCAVEYLSLVGRHFGASAGTRTVMLLDPRSHAPLRALRAYTWGDGRIGASVPEPVYARPGQTYKVGIVDQDRNLISNAHEVKICPDSFRLSGAIRLENCAATAADVSVKILRNDRLVATVPARVSSSDDFVFEYNATVPTLDARTPQSMTLQPQLAAGKCNGGEWSPSNMVHRMSYTHLAVRQDFAYRVAMQEVRIDGSTVAGLMQELFSDLRIHLNSLAPDFTHPNSRYLANDAFLELPGSLGGTRIAIPIEDAVSGAFRYYINDLNMQSFTVRAAGHRFRMRIVFESSGNEIKGYCWDGVCLPLGDDGAPDGNVDNLIVDVYFTPIRYNIAGGTGGDISIGNVEATIQANLAGNGIAKPVVAFMENDIKKILFPRLQKVIRDAIQQRAIQDAVARGVRRSLDSRLGEAFLGNVENVQGVRMENGNIFVRFLPR